MAYIKVMEQGRTKELDMFAYFCQENKKSSFCFFGKKRYYTVLFSATI